MPRQIRIEFPGALYHVMARGDRREPIFLDDEDCGSFLKVLAEASHKMGWRIHAYALMVNHYHLVIETPEPNLVKGMTSVQGTYTARFNARHKLRGHVFGGRYKAVVVQHGKGEYFSTLLDYVHLNPVRAKLVKRVDGLDSYPWTSLSFYRKPPSKREPWQVVEKGLAETGLRDTASGRRKFLERLEMKAGEQAASRAGLSEIEGQSLQSTLRRGWYFGTQAFGDQLQDLAEKALRAKRGNANYYGSEIKRHDEIRAQKILSAGLSEFELGRNELADLKKSDWRKCLIALAIKRETSMSLLWISRELEMGVPAGVSRGTRLIGTRLDKERKLKKIYGKISSY